MTYRAIQLKFVDDSTKSASINLKRSLKQDTRIKPYPLNYHEITQMVIDPKENVLQQELDSKKRPKKHNKKLLSWFSMPQ